MEDDACIGIVVIDMLIVSSAKQTNLRIGLYLYIFSIDQTENFSGLEKLSAA